MFPMSFIMVFQDVSEGFSRVSCGFFGGFFLVTGFILSIKALHSVSEWFHGVLKWCT